jgi:hypothetical protein
MLLLRIDREEREELEVVFLIEPMTVRSALRYGERQEGYGGTVNPLQGNPR